MKISKLTYIHTLPKNTQDKIVLDVYDYLFSVVGQEKMTEEDRKRVLGSRLCDLEEQININVYINPGFYDEAKNYIASLGYDESEVETILAEVVENRYTTMDEVKEHIKNY